MTINVTLMPNITEFDKAIENFFVPVTVLVTDAIGGRIEKQHRREFVLDKGKLKLDVGKTLTFLNERMRF